jgi:hypothetical protein
MPDISMIGQVLEPPTRYVDIIHQGIRPSGPDLLQTSTIPFGLNG